MSEVWLLFQIGLAGFIGTLLLIATGNLLTWRRLGQYAAPTRFPHASILIPARDEELNIEPCVRSLLAQDYPDFEVIVLDDASSDRTGQILADLALSDTRLQVLAGRPLAPGWLGKHWACHQLAQSATGELLLFSDADTRHHPRALRDAVASLESEQADLLTALPRQMVVTWAERLIVPIIPWSILAFIPVGPAHRLRRPSWSAAIGQFMLFRREAYQRIGGHAAVRQHAVDDLALARRVKAAGLRWRIVDGIDRISCRMYRDFRQVRDGLSKNLYASFNYKAPQFVFVWAWLLTVFAAWPALALLSLAGLQVTGFHLPLAWASVIGSLALWGIVYRRSGFELVLAPLYPLSILLFAFVAMRSMALTLTGRATWRGRTLIGYGLK